MLKYFVVCAYLLVFTFSDVMGQSSKKAKKDEPTTTLAAELPKPSIKQQLDAYHIALTYADARAATMALINIIALEGDRSTYKDTLALLYYQGQSFGNSLLVARDIYAKNPENLTILEVKAVCEQSLGLAKEALDSYELLLAKQNNLNWLYETASLQYQLKRYGECEETIKKILAHPDVEKAEVSIGSREIQPQKVGVRAAVFNMLGVISSDLNKNEEAKTYYKKALEIAPDFAIAKTNLAAIEKTPETKSDTKTPSKPKK